MKITLCGSARFEDMFHEWNERLTLKGHIVYSLAVYPSSKGGDKNWYNENQKTMLDLVHMSKILNSDAIVVVLKDDYIGDSTTREIAWARLLDKRVYWTQPQQGTSRWYPFMDNPDYWAGCLI